MKQVLFVALLLFVFGFGPSEARAQMMGQGMMNVSFEDDGHTLQEEAEGKEVWEKLQNRTVVCEELSTEDFEVLGEYFMGQRLGKLHPAMNAMMVQRMGEEGEELMHEVLGRQASDCDVNSSFPEAGNDFLPMMSMMTGYQRTGQGFSSSPYSMMGSYGGMMGGWGTGWSILWVITWVAVIGFIVAGIVWLVRDSHRKK